MLRLNAPTPTVPGTAQTPDAEIYKVLVLDRQTKDIIAPLLRVSDLRRHGVTLHLMMDAERHSIPDVPAVYFVGASDGAVTRIVQARKQLCLVLSLCCCCCCCYSACCLEAAFDGVQELRQ